MPISDRRAFLKTSAASAVLAAAGARAATPVAYTLPPLPYAPEALDAAIDAETMKIHHGKHHQAYVSKLNEAMAKHPELQPATLAELVNGVAEAPEDIRAAVRNHGGGHWNHTFFWHSMAPAGAGGAASSALAEAATRAFGSLDGLKKAVSDKAMATFGSGWAWLVKKADGSLAAVSTPNQDNPMMHRVVAEDALGVPLLGVDVWEHAYYLRYQNKRADYLAAWWAVVDWKAVSARFAA